jgi:regulator of ribonuclease activity A
MKDSITDLLPELCDHFPDMVQVAEPMFINFGGREAFGGEIITVKTCEDNSLVKEQLSLPGSGKVLVVDGAGSMRRALMGDMLAESALQNGWEGVIIYGCIRDVNAVSQLDLGVQALGTHPLKTVRKGVGEVNVRVSFAGLHFEPGEYVYADNNGMLVSAKQLILPDLH